MLRTRVVLLELSVVPQVRTNILPVPTLKKKKKKKIPGLDLKLESLSTMKIVQFTHQKLYIYTVET